MLQGGEFLVNGIMAVRLAGFATSAWRSSASAQPSWLASPAAPAWLSLLLASTSCQSEEGRRMPGGIKSKRRTRCFECALV